MISQRQDLEEILASLKRALNDDKLALLDVQHGLGEEENDKAAADFLQWNISELEEQIQETEKELSQL